MNFATFEEESQQQQKEDPLQKKINEIISILEKIPSPDSPEVVPFLWNFISVYVTFLEQSPLMSSITLDVQGVNDNVVQFIINMRKTATQDIVIFLKNFSIVGSRIKDPELRELWSILSLDTSQGNLIENLSNFIGTLDNKKKEELNSLFIKEISKYIKTPPKESSFCKIILRKDRKKFFGPGLVLFLFVIAMIIYYKKSKGKKKESIPIDYYSE